MSENTNSTTGDTAAELAHLAEFRRKKALEHEKAALDFGDHPTSMRHAIAQILCCGRNVKESEGGDMTAERALMRFAAVTTKAVAIALACSKMCEDEHDVELGYEEASMALLGVSELLTAAPRLIDEFTGLDLRSNGETRHWDEADGDEEVAS